MPSRIRSKTSDAFVSASGEEVSTAEEGPCRVSVVSSTRFLFPPAPWMFWSSFPSSAPSSPPSVPPNSAPTSSRSPQTAWCSHASISPTNRTGSLCWCSMAFGTPPGPPLVSAVMNRRNSALCRVRATSSTQYLNSVGRCFNAVIARVRVSSTSSPPSSSAKLRHSRCTQRHSRSCAFSWYELICDWAKGKGQCCVGKQRAWIWETQYQHVP
mmetsp:Transcript_263/g.852  ORF Transcript_263/g.852 Transcript_263/m.852 type:complete len:212 (+) Transcript_263:151-786(+)